MSQAAPKAIIPEEPSDAQETRRARILFALFLGALIVSIILYLWAHWAGPTEGVLLAETKARDDTLASIVQATDALTDPISTIKAREILSNTRTAVGTALTPQQNVTLTTAIDGLLAAYGQSLSLAAKEAEKTRISALLPELARTASQIPGTDAGGVISKTLAQINQEIGAPEPDQANLRLLFAQLTDEVNQSGTRYFWSTGFGKWAELAVWAWFGSLLYVLVEIYRHYPKDSEERRFTDYTPWYMVSAVKGPFIALLILFFINSVKVDMGGISLAPGETRIELLVFLAAVLGLYSRVAKEQLEIFIKQVFSTAWTNAADTPTKMSIQPAAQTIDYGTKLQLSVAPEQEVTWSLEANAPGSIDEEGLYAAPDAGDDGKKITITATSKTDPTKSAQSTITLKKKVV